MDFKYGSEKINIELPGSSTALAVKEPKFAVDQTDFNYRLSSLVPAGSYKSIGIVVSDKTRLCSYEKYLPWLTSYLGEKGGSPENITFYIAYGTHPSQTREECIASYGDTYLRYRFIHHDCSDLSSMKHIGDTSSGTKVLVNSSIFKHDLLILMGAVSHHYFAGYGGGRKLIFPGLAYKDSIYSNHKLFIDFEMGRLSPGCQSGEMEANPVSKELREIDTMLPPKVIITGILDPRGKVTQFEFASSYEEFLNACRIYDGYYKYQKDTLFDLVIASAGGYPKDINMIQTHKAIHNSAAFVRDGGTLIILGECRDGIGNDSFLDLFRMDKASLIKSLGEHYSGNGGTALATMEKAARINIKFVTSLDLDSVKLMGMEKIDIKTAGQLVKNQSGSVAYIKNASIIFR